MAQRLPEPESEPELEAPRLGLVALRRGSAGSEPPGSELAGSELAGSGLPGSGLPGSGLPGSGLPGSELAGSELAGRGLDAPVPGSLLPVMRQRLCALEGSALVLGEWPSSQPCPGAAG